MTGPTVTLPTSGGRTRDYTMIARPVMAPRGTTVFNRKALSAVHVVVDPFSSTEPALGADIDWAQTIAFRNHILDLGLDIAEAMDTAQRGMGLSWESARELIERTLDGVGADRRHRVFSGISTDHLDLTHVHTIDAITQAYAYQLETVQRMDGRVIMMASPALAKAARSPSDYIAVYDRILEQADKPVILHWLGDMFDPRLAGYWGHGEFEPALETVLEIIDRSKAKVDGLKLSLLDDAKELAMRARMPDGVKMYTGDDFNYPDLIAGDEDGFSHALLGIFDPIAPAASAALAALARGDREDYDRLLAPTVPLSRTIFRAPTQHYKTGVVFLAYLNGFQDHFVMLGGRQSMRPLPYFAEIFVQADEAGLLRDPDLAAQRMSGFLAMYGISQTGKKQLYAVGSV